MLIIGHRGAPSLKHENTLESFNIALQKKVNGIELDVQLTKDNQLVVFHDLHTYSLNQKDSLIKEMFFIDLQKIKPTIPTLEDVLKIVPPNKELHIEIKSNQISNAILINKTYKLVSQYQLIDQTIFSSFNPFLLLTLKQLCPSVRIGLLWTQCPNEPWFITHYSYYKILPYSFHASIEYITTEIAKWAKDKSMKLYCYTVNNHKQLKKAQKLHADGIFSDYPNILD